MLVLAVINRSIKKLSLFFVFLYRTISNKDTAV